MNKKERAEGIQSKIFVKLFNEKYGTDYRINLPEEEYSIVDRRAISYSGKYPELKIQLKEIMELDRSDFTKSIFGENIEVFDTNIFKLLNPAIKKIEKKYGSSAKDIILVLNIGVSEDWLRDWITNNPIGNTNFKGIYCLCLPSNICLDGFIFPLKEI